MVKTEPISIGWKAYPVEVWRNQHFDGAWLRTEYEELGENSFAFRMKRNKTNTAI